MSRTAYYGIECPTCELAYGSRYQWLVELRMWLHDALAGPKLRKQHRQDENESRARLGLPRRYK